MTLRTSSAHLQMVAAQEGINLALLHLQLARKDYAASGLPTEVRTARVEALDAKIAALRDVHANPTAHPWIGDIE